VVLARHPQAPILLSQPGLGVVLAARLLGEFGNDPVRYATAKGRKAYAGTAPITRASGMRTIVSARVARNDWLTNACTLWAFAALSASPRARACYDRHRTAGNSHQQALRALASPAGRHPARLPGGPGPVLYAARGDLSEQADG
jgi:hypothetical protein